MATKIELTKGYSTIIDDESLSELGDRSWHAFVNRNNVYAATNYRREDGSYRVMYMHRLLAGAESDEFVDHVDGDSLNNRLDNLRICSNGENLRNRGKQSNNKSGFKGVHWHKQRGKWRALIRCNGKVHYLGHFDDPCDAHEAYKAAGAKLHGAYFNPGEQP